MSYRKFNCEVWISIPLCLLHFAASSSIGLLIIELHGLNDYILVKRGQIDSYNGQLHTNGLSVC